MSCTSQETIYLPNVGYDMPKPENWIIFHPKTYFMKSSLKSDLVIVLEYRSFLQIQPKPKLHGPNLTIDLWDLYGPHVIIGLAIHIWLTGWFFSKSLCVRKELSSVYSFLIMQLRQMSSIILQIARFFGRKSCGKMTF